MVTGNQKQRGAELLATEPARRAMNERNWIVSGREGKGREREYEEISDACAELA